VAVGLPTNNKTFTDGLKNAFAKVRKLENDRAVAALQKK
jgi:hypothetical protein